MTQHSILLIEDSKLHQTFIDRALRRANYDLTLTSSGIEGLSALTKKKFDLVIVDLALPDINGLSVVRTIRDMKQIENIPVIVFTSNMPLDDRKDLDELNVSAYIEKGSFKPNELIDLIEESIQSVLYLRAIELLVVESSREFEQYIRVLLPESRANLRFVEARHGLENFLSESVPDAILFHQRDLSDQNFTWIARHYQDGLFKGIPWLVAMEQDIPPEMSAITHNRLILPVRIPCSDLALKKTIEMLAHVHQTKLGSEEHSLELEIAYNELEKNRAILSEAKSELTLRKKNLGDVLMKIGKEVRQPLTTILGYAEGLKHGEDYSDQSQLAIDSIVNNGKYLAQVVDDILSIAAIEKGYFSVQKKSFDILPVLSELFDVAESRAQSVGLSFSILFDSDIPTEIFSDPTLIKQILRGLIDNALKFTTEGTIQLRVKYDTTYNHLRLSVADSGPGIAAEQIPSLFDGISGPGDVASQVGSGNGLGLAFVKFASERLGGEVQVESRTGEGSTFTLIIDPGEIRDSCSAELAHTIIELGSHEAELDPKQLVGKVLIVDTHLETRRLFGFLLERTGIEFTFVKESFEVFDLALSGDFDILLADIMTAQTDGFALVRNLRKRGFSKPILTVSSCAFEDQRQRCLDVGCDVVLEKPFTLDKFYQTLAELIHTRRPIVPTVANSSRTDAASSPQKQDAIEIVPAKLVPDFIDLDSAVVPLVLEFIDCMRLQLAQIEQAMQRHAWQEIIESALELYSSAEMYGYSLLSHAALQLDDAAQAQDANLVAEAIEQLGRIAAAMENGRQQLIGTIGVTGSSATLRAVTKEVDDFFNPTQQVSETSEPVPSATEVAQEIDSFPFDIDEAFLTEPLLKETKQKPEIVPNNETTQIMPTVGIEDVKTKLTTNATTTSDISEEFRRELRSKLALTHNCLQTEDWSMIGEIVNELSASASMFGLDELSHKLLLLEAQCGLQDAEEAKLALQSLMIAAQPTEVQESIETSVNESIDAAIRDSVEQLARTVAKPTNASGERKTVDPVEAADPSEQAGSAEPQQVPPANASAEVLVEALTNILAEVPTEIQSEAVSAEPSPRQPNRETIIIESELVKTEPSTAPLVLDFLDELKALIESLRCAFNQEDWQSVREIADEVYGSAGICGYAECANVARSLKVAANMGETDSLSSTFNEFNSICEAMFRGRDRLQQ